MILLLTLFNVDKVISLAFRDKYIGEIHGTREESLEPGWRRFGPRRLFHLILQKNQMMKDVLTGTSGSQANESIFSESNFFKGMNKVLCSFGSEDNLPYIWRSYPSRLVPQLSEASPLLVSINAMQLAEHGPVAIGRRTRQREEIPCADYFFTHITVGNIPNNQHPKIHSIIFGRVCLAYERYNLCATGSILSYFMNSHERIYVGDGIYLDELFDSLEKMKQGMKAFRKHGDTQLLKVQVFAQQNTNKWRHINNKLYLFEESNEQIQEIKDLCEIENIYGVMQRAQEGIITYDTMKCLINMKKYHEDLRRESKKMKQDGSWILKKTKEKYGL